MSSRVESAEFFSPVIKVAEKLAYIDKRNPVLSSLALDFLEGVKLGKIRFYISRLVYDLRAGGYGLVVNGKTAYFASFFVPYDFVNRYPTGKDRQAAIVSPLVDSVCAIYGLSGKVYTDFQKLKADLE